MGLKLNEEKDYFLKLRINEQFLIQLLVVSFLGLILTGVLVFLFSQSIISVLCSLVFGSTAVVLFLYFFIEKHRFSLLNAELIKQDDDLSEENVELHSVMKIE